MKFVEIVDSDESDADGAPFHGSPPKLTATPEYAGGIAERTKDRSRKAKASNLETSPTTVDDLEDFVDETAPLPSPVSARKKRARRIAQSDDEDDDLSRAFEQSDPTTSPEAEIKLPKKETTKKPKTKRDKRKALAAYEAPVASSASAVRTKRASRSEQPVYAATCDMHGSPLPTSHIDATPNLPTPLAKNASPAFTVSISRVPEGTVKNSESTLEASSSVDLKGMRSPCRRAVQSSATTSTDTPHSRTDVIHDDHDELTANVEVDGVGQVVVHRPLIEASASTEEQGTKQEVMETPPVKKRGRPKKSATSKSKIDAKDLSVTKMSDEQHNVKEQEAQETPEQAEMKPVVKLELEVPETPLLDKSTTLTDEKENSQPSAVKQDPGRVVNYAASGKNPLLTLKLSSGPRYRVGLSKRIRVDSLHQNIVRK